MAEPLEEAIPRRQAEDHDRNPRQPRYHVILWNDNDHSYAYVITMLAEIFGHPPERDFRWPRRSIPRDASSS